MTDFDGRSGGTPGDQNQGAARRPKIGDSRPAPGSAGTNAAPATNQGGSGEGSGTRRRRRRRRGGGGEGGGENGQNQNNQDRGQQRGGQNGGGGRGRKPRNEPVSAVVADNPVELDESQLKRRRGRSRKGKAVGRYLMVVSKREDATHIAVLEGRHLIEYYVSRPSDDVFQIHGNIYLGRVQNVLPGMEAAFVDISTPKNAVLYRGDVTFDSDDVEPSQAKNLKIEQILKARQTILCQVTKNPIAHKGARLTTEVSLPGRFVVLVPNSSTYGISKRLPDAERKRLRQALDRVKPKEHGVIVRTAAENITAEEIERDVLNLIEQWKQIDALAKRSKVPSLLYQEPDMSTRVIREEFNKDYRGVVLDDPALHAEVADYVGAVAPALAERVEYYDLDEEPLPIFERYHVHEQLHRALDRKVWVPSGGSLIIEHTQALTVIHVNTGKNVGSSSV